MTRQVWILLAGALIAAACRTPGQGKRDPVGEKAPAMLTPPDKRWNPPTPGDDKFDWIQLKSGEWLKGEVTSLREDSLEFDSDELDELKLDWEDVALLRSPKSLSVLREGKSTSTGTVLIQNDQVTVRKADGATDTFPRDDIVSIVPGSGSLGYWSGTFALGLTTVTGNTDQTDLQLRVVARMRSPLNRLIFDYLGNYGEVDGTQNLNNHLFTGRWDRFVSRRYYLTPITFEYFRDPFQNTEARITPAVGFGYHIVGKHLDKKKFDWDIAPYAGYRYTKFFSGDTTESTTATAGFKTYFNWDVTKDTELTCQYNLAVGIPDTNDTNQNAQLVLSYDIWKDLDLDITFVWDRVGDPRADSDGVTPQKNDFRLSIGIGWDF